jgi:hypothetical protein
MFCKAEARQARTFYGDAKAINEKVRLYANVGAALITARSSEKSAYDAIASVIPWEKFLTSVAEAEALARPETLVIATSAFGVGHRHFSKHFRSRAFRQPHR